MEEKTTEGKSSRWPRSVRLALLISLFAAAGFALVFTLYAVIGVYEHGESHRFSSQTSAARGHMRVVGTAAMIYHGTYQNGYPASLKVLGPSESPDCNAANLIEAELGSGERNEYFFVYRPGPPIPEPPSDCLPGVASFTLSARPREYNPTGEVIMRSYIMDESSAIHFTNEDRPATLDDPVED